MITINFFEALTLLLIGLKLANVISWSWAAVLSPIWITLVYVVIRAIVESIAENVEEKKS